MRLLKVILAVALAYTACSNAQKREPKYEVVSKSIVKATYYHDNGTVYQVGCFRNGRLDGEWIMYAVNGKKIAIGHYEEGKRNGEWFFWKINGEALREVTYLNGKLVNVIEWSNAKDISF